MKNSYTEGKASFPIWKWILELLSGIVIFLFLYVFSQGAMVIPDLIAKDIVILLASVLLMALFILWTRLFEKQWRWDLFTNGAGRHLTAGLLTGFVFFAAVSGIMFISGCYKAEYAAPDWSLIFTNFCFYFLVACGEEVIFRGILFRMIDERFNFWWALAVSALVFGFVHLMNSNATIWSSIAISIEAGILLGAAFKYAKSLWLPIGIHWAWNFTQGNVFGFEVSGHEKEISIFNSSVSGPDLITGGAFGPEASIIAVILGSAISALFILKILRSGNGR